jgi:hypothetical protein
VNPTTPLTHRLTVEAIAPTVDGIRHAAPQPLGTWHSRWACLYLDPFVPVADERPMPAPARPLPSLPAAA